MINMKMKIYGDALKNEALFPPGDYSLEIIYKIIAENIDIPDSHLENRPDKKFLLWKNYTHTALKDIARIEFLGDEMYRFS